MHELKGFDHEDVPELKDAAEFVAYDLLLHADQPQTVAWMLLKLSPKLRRLAAVQRALRTFVALQTDDFHGFFVEFSAMTLLERAASLRHFPKVWTRSLRMINKGFGKQDRFPLEEFARWMCLADPKSEGEGGELAESLCMALNIQTQRHSPPSPPKTIVADSWEIVDEVPVPTKPRSLGFAKFKFAPLHDQMDANAVRVLLRAVALLIKSDLARKGLLLTTTEMIMGTAHSSG
ncbi:Serine protease [Phytophthora megakarya]|uniref:Serine protease n=1 Tax=Phytophthora megakarya TaxID=4795 RepID=A0A225VVF9_9STRA|nr:Serine protease [Phytophthora megakarya]